MDRPVLGHVLEWCAHPVIVICLIGALCNREFCTVAEQLSFVIHSLQTPEDNFSSTDAHSATLGTVSLS